MSNIILEHYGLLKKEALKNSPFSCFSDSDIEAQPHQIDAFCAATEALNTGGIVLADEVGLGKTIEAGLTLKYLLKKGAKKIIIVVPSSLRKQWQIELDEKFDIKTDIIDRYALISENTRYFLKDRICNKDKVFIAICTYYFAPQLIRFAEKTPWDFVIIDEAHNLRNVFRGTKRAKRLYDATQNIPKLLLTATPIQNNIEDLYALISFIDPRIFCDERVFDMHVALQDYDFVKNAIAPVIQRTLRRDVGKYMQFKKRTAKTFDFHLSPKEKALYELVDRYLKQPDSYGFPNSNNRMLLLLVVRKMLASSSRALIETFEVIKDRLDKLYQGTKSMNAQQGFDRFLSYLDDEEEETGVLETKEDEALKLEKEKIDNERKVVSKIIELAESIDVNAKMEKLLESVEYAFEYQRKAGLEEKIVIFTESKRTQRYIRTTLLQWGFGDDEVVIFNGDMSDEKSKQIYNRWKALRHGEKDYGQQIEFRHAMVDYFKKKGKIFISTDAGSEGLNLQFCNIVINYDLPWNPMKIEQRIGRCHRFGQTHDVIAINFLNTENEADKRVYDILSKKFELFEGVFGASDKALEVLESGSNFEKTIFDIYQTTNTSYEFTKKFDALDRKLTRKTDKVANTLRGLLQTQSSDEKEKKFDKAYLDILEYLDDLKFWEDVPKPTKIIPQLCCSLKNNPFTSYGINSGYMIFGGLVANNKLIKAFPVLTDINGGNINIPETDIVKAINVDSSEIDVFKPNPKEQEVLRTVLDRVESISAYEYEKTFIDIMNYNKSKVDNWVAIQESLLGMDLQEKADEIKAMKEEMAAMTNFVQKIDFKDKIEKKEKELVREQNRYYQKMDIIKAEAENNIKEFNKKLYVKSMFLVRAIVKF